MTQTVFHNKIQVFLSLFREMNYKCPCCQALDNCVNGRTSQSYTLIAELMMFQLRSVCWDFIGFSAEKASWRKCTPNPWVMHWDMLGDEQLLSLLNCCCVFSWVTYIVGSFHLLVYVWAGYFCCFEVSVCMFLCVCAYICTPVFFRFL